MLHLIMKKTYIKPQMSVYDLELEGMIAASLKIDSNNKIDTSVSGAQLGNKYDTPWNSNNWE